MLDPREGLILRTYIPPASQLNGSKGGLAGQIVFAKYVYCWKEHNYLVYIAEGFKDGSFGTTQYVAVLCEPEGMETATSQSAAADALILAASRWTEELHGEIWIFDQMFWQKNAGLWQEVQKASWEDVILNGEMKQRLQDDVEGFFDERETYERFAIPWKVSQPGPNSPVFTIHVVVFRLSPSLAILPITRSRGRFFLTPISAVLYSTGPPVMVKPYLSKQ